MHAHTQFWCRRILFQSFFLWNQYISHFLACGQTRFNIIKKRLAFLFKGTKWSIPSFLALWEIRAVGSAKGLLGANGHSWICPWALLPIREMSERSLYFGYRKNWDWKMWNSREYKMWNKRKKKSRLWYFVFFFLLEFYFALNLFNFLIC